MTVNRALRLLAGTVVLLSLGLAVTVNIHFLWLTGFVGLNLFQSALTNWCPAMTIFKHLGLKDDTCAGSH